jgi:AhpD family alkylhydroperoxidase
MKVTQNELEQMAVQQYGIVPPLVKQISEVSTSVAYHYLIGLALVKEGSFTPVGQNVIQLKISCLNQCGSCIKGHSFLLKKLGLSDEDILSIRQGILTSDKELNRLIDLTQTIFYWGRRGFPSDVAAKLEQMSATKGEVFEVISLIASKTISNYINNIKNLIETNVNA